MASWQHHSSIQLARARAVILGLGCPWSPARLELITRDAAVAPTEQEHATRLIPGERNGRGETGPAVLRRRRVNDTSCD